ncbi:MAG: hypothetical protein ABR955_00170 [Verrucomicrobiota bacterium]
MKSLPGVLHFNVGKMVPSRRPVVYQTYQVALNLVFQTNRHRTIIRFIPGTSSSWKGVQACLQEGCNPQF